MRPKISPQVVRVNCSPSTMSISSAVPRLFGKKVQNRAEFFRGAVNKYGWVDMGSSFLPAEINAAFLWAQLENLDDIQAKRKKLWEQYFVGLQSLAGHGFFRLPQIPSYATNNAHMFYIVCRNLEERSGLIKFLKEHDVTAPFHYLALHKSEYYLNHFEESRAA